MEKIAILFDGGFFQKRLRHLKPESRNFDPKRFSKAIANYANDHVKNITEKEGPHALYRCFYYDCNPSDYKVHHPLTDIFIKFGESEHYKYKKALFEQVRKLRKFALRLGILKTSKEWKINPQKVKPLLKGGIKISDLGEDDVKLDFRQKGVDMMIGIDIASLAFKSQVSKIVLIAGDTDFVPAAKLARREGIDFILDPMWNPIDPSLNEHIDGIYTASKKPSYI